MASLFRIVVLYLCFAAPAFAQQCFEYEGSYAGQTFKGSSANNVCQSLKGFYLSMATGWSASSTLVGTGPNYLCKLRARSPDGDSVSDYEFPIYGTPKPCTCAAPFVEGPDGQCACPAGQMEEVDQYGVKQCVPNEDSQCQTFYALGNTLGGRFTQEYRLTGKIPDGSKFCMPGQFENENRGCIVLFEQSAAFGSGDDWVTEGRFDGKPGENGLACTVGTGDTPAVPEPEKCPKGYTGTVNGVEVCVDKVPDSGFEPGSDETTVDDGTNTTTTRTNSNTTCENGRCTTTTTVTTTVTNNSTGTSTSSSNSTTTTQSQSDYCKANPKAKLCGGSGLPNIDGGGSGGGGNGEEDPSSFTGACAGGFQCKGDAIQCAIAREQHIRACRLFDKESPESKLYEEFKGKEGDQTKELPGNETVSIGDKINTTDALGAGGAGLSDLSLTVWNQQVTLPLSMLNQYLAAMGNVLLAVSFLLAFRIVARG